MGWEGRIKKEKLQIIEVFFPFHVSFFKKKLSFYFLKREVKAFLDALYQKRKN